jgi:hypothetical protein
MVKTADSADVSLDQAIRLAPSVVSMQTIGVRPVIAG